MTAQDVTRFYGQTNAQFTVVADGLVSGDSITNLPGTLAFTVEDTNNTVVSVNTNTPAGNYTDYSRRPEFERLCDHLQQRHFDGRPGDPDGECG